MHQLSPRKLIENRRGSTQKFIEKKKDEWPKKYPLERQGSRHTLFSIAKYIPLRRGFALTATIFQFVRERADNHLFNQPSDHTGNAQERSRDIVHFATNKMHRVGNQFKLVKEVFDHAIDVPERGSSLIQKPAQKNREPEDGEG